MTPAEPTAPAGRADDLDAYAGGLEAECALLADILHLASAQHAACRGDDVAAMTAATREREAVAARLEVLEARLVPVRAAIASISGDADRDSRFLRISARHREAAALVGRVLTQDRATLALLDEQAARRRDVLHQLEAGEATLAAYRRAIHTGTPNAGLLNRLG